MAYKIKFGTFSKLENSTAQPTVTGWAEYDITLKNGADLSNPVIELSESYTAIANYNYAYFQGRYYWIVSRNMLKENFCVMQLKIDVLATYKSQIGAASLYILRASAESDGNIRDAFYGTKANSTKYRDQQPLVPVGGHETSVPQDYSDGVIVLNISGIDTAGASTLLELLPSDFAALVDALYTSINGFQLSDVIAKVVQSFGGNPQSLINSAMWFPFPFDVYDVRQVKIGGWAAVDGNNDPITGGTITDPVILLPTVSFTLRKHPLASTRGNYLNLAPYTQYTLGLPGVGVVNLDNGKLQGETKINIYRYMDAFTGQMFVKVTANSSGQTLAFMNGQIGVPISLRGSNNANSLISGGLSAITSAIGAGLASGPMAPVAIAGAVSSGITLAVDTIAGTPTSSSMGAGFAGISGEYIWLDTICYDITDADNAEHGKPLCKVRTPSTLSGFMIASEGYVAIPGPLPEQQEVRRLLETGFFYE